MIRNQLEEIFIKNNLDNFDLYQALQNPFVEVRERVLLQVRTPSIEVTPEERRFYSFLARWDIFYERGIPVDLWKSLLPKGLRIIREAVENGGFNFAEHPEYQSFIEDYWVLNDKISRMREYQHLFMSGY